MINLQTLLDLIRFLPVIAIFIIAAHQDFRHGEASNKLWLYTPIGLALTILEYLFNPNYFLIFYAGFGVALSLVLFYLNGWGGADTKALIMTSLAIPATPNFLPTCLTILGTAALAALPISIIKKQNTLRYLPYMMIGVIISLFL